MLTVPAALSKVPEVTLFFWLIKMMSTTVGETAADFLNVNLGFGLSLTSLTAGCLLAVLLLAQMRAQRYIPALYWSTVVMVSIFGTLITDNFTDASGIPLLFSIIMFSSALILTFMLWHRSEGTLSIHSITTPAREAFYWAAILFTFALGTAVGDGLAEGLNLGYLPSALVFGGAIALVALVWKGLRLNTVLCFWLAYILTRPLGASCGDLLAQPVNNGGFGIGIVEINLLFLASIAALVGYLTLAERAAD
ncbi:membrane protein [Erwinia typographi]|uniref:Membrane protein n=1 Tax=Erwinia typographi TaxID=371042 RepID=A0A0A3YUK9_9GAMM|nr:membrane protein [Erwinia typographi]KGT90310.1 membrane protein [Erwinia typographi]